MRKEKKAQLQAILKDKIDELMRLSYEDLLERVDKDPEVITHGTTGSEDFYQMEVEVFFDDPKLKSGNLRVMATIDNGGWRAFAPISDSFIITPEGKFL